MLMAMALAVACSSEKPTPAPEPTPEPTPEPPSTEDVILELTSEDSLWYEASGGEGEITYTLENSVSGVSIAATSSVEWISITSVAESIGYAVAENTTAEQRRGVITVSYGDKSFGVSIMQYEQLDADVVFNASSLDGSLYMGAVEGVESYSYSLLISDKGLTQSGNMYDNASYYLFDLYAAIPATGDVATIPEGEYTLGIDKSAGVINGGYSKLVQTSTSTKTTSRFTDIRLVVSEGSLEAFITLENGKKHYLRYEGSLDIEPYEERKGYSTLRRDYYFDINNGLFVGAFVGNYYYANYDTCQVYLWEFLDLETGEESGDMFQLDLQLPRGSRDIRGTYTPGTSDGHFLIGAVEDMGGGQFMQVNTWYMTAGYADFAPLVNGTITVESDDMINYTFTIDCEDDKGNNISGKFRGTGEFIDW